MARCSWVPALETLTPSTAAISALASPAWNLSATSSRSRGSSVGERGADGGAAQRGLGVVLRRGGLDVGRVGGQRGGALAPPQLVERGVAGDAEQPGARRAAAGLVRALLAVCALERGRGDVLCRRAIAQQRGHVGVDVVARRPVERIEVQRRAGGPRWQWGGQRAGHIGYYGVAGNASQTGQVRNRSALRLFWVAHASCTDHPRARRSPLPPRRRPRRPRAPDVWATVNACDTHERPNQIGHPRRDGRAARARRACTCASASSSGQRGRWRTLKSSR